MELIIQQAKQSQKSISQLFYGIENATQNMNKAFESAILRHEEQFIKTYRTKINQLMKLFDVLKKTIQDKFVKNAIINQLQTVLKERDYFKYECIKINNHYQNLKDQNKNTIAQMTNTTQQMIIYKHLLSSQKIRANQIQQNVNQLKKSIRIVNDKNSSPLKYEEQFVSDYKSQQKEKQIFKCKKQIKEKNQIIRVLQEKNRSFQNQNLMSHHHKIQKKELYELFKICSENWKREISSKSKVKKQNFCDNFGQIPQKISAMNKKELLKVFFTHPQFLKFIQKLLFDENFKVIFEKSSEQKYLQRNREKLYDLMFKKRIHTASSTKYRNKLMI